MNFGALGGLFPFLPLLLASRGLDASQISWVMVVIPITSLLVPPFWGLLADTLRVRIPLLRVACFGSALGALLLLPDWHFLGSILAVGVLSFFRSPITSLADAAAYSVLGNKGNHFSLIRVWGSIGFVFFALMMGLLGGSTRPVMLISVACAALILSGLSTLPLKSASITKERGILKQTIRLLRPSSMLFFLAGNVFYYAGHATYDAFFSLHARQLGYQDDFVGLAWSTGVIAEILLMLLAPRFLQRVRGSLLLVICAFAAALRWTLLSQVSESWALVMIQSLHGITFGLWYLSIVKYIQTRAPEHLRASLQSVSMACMGLGMTTGYLAGGELFLLHGGETLYKAAAGAALAAALMYGLSFRRRRASSP